MKKLLVLLMATTIAISSTILSFAGEWKSDDKGWKYQNDDGSYIKSSWKEINEKWYYFNDAEYMLSSTTTPDGYTVNESGEWIQSFEDKYTFDLSGKWVNENKIPEGEYVYYPGEQTTNTIVEGSSSRISSFNYIRLYKDDIVNSGIYVPVSKAGQLDITKEGVFLVGRDIKAGLYNLSQLKYDRSSLNMPHCLIFNTIPSSKDQFAAQKNLVLDSFVGKLKNNTITVKDGQYVQLILCTADFVRP